MGFLDKLKKMVGFSGIKVDLLLPKSQYQQGEPITGKVVITGGAESKLANKLAVAIVEEHPEIVTQTHTVPPSTPGGTATTLTTESLTSCTVTHPGTILAQKFEIGAGATLEYPLTLALPAVAAVSGPRQQWSIKTELDIEGAIDAGDTDRFTVIPGDSLQAARQAICQAAGFPPTGLLHIEVVDVSGNRMTNRVYYL